jgi:hypothetical protein
LRGVDSNPKVAAGSDSPDVVLFCSHGPVEEFCHYPAVG